MFPTNRFVTDRVDHWATVDPDRDAIVYGERRWTWSQFRDRVHRVAGGLRAAGIGRGGRVAFLDKNNPACLEVMLGASLIGASVAAVNWRLAGDELDYVLNDSAATVLFVGPDLVPAIESVKDKLGSVQQVIVLDDAYSRFVDESPYVERDSSVAEDDVWLVMYSSGTTGHPKGVMLTHRNLVLHCENACHDFPFTPADHNLVAMPLFHVGGTSYALFGIYYGALSTVAREATGEILFPAFHSGVTHVFVVPALLSTILNAGDAAIAALAKVRYLVYGAAPMPLALLRRALHAWPEANFVQVYGQTEISGLITSLSGPAHRDSAHPERLTSAGKPVPGGEVRVVDPDTGSEADTGELWFRSEQTMTGYLNHPEATAGAITPDGWLRTGDIGHVDEDGFVYVSDRIKDMIITGGENVYSPEVERVLAEHPAVAEVAVIGVPDEHWGESIKAFVAFIPGCHATEDELHTFTRERLAGYKCPRSFDTVDSLPRNPSGKVLKRDLRKPYWAESERNI